VLLLPCASCASVDVGDIATRFCGGDIAGTRAELERLAQEDSGNAHLWLMNRAVADLAAGEPKAGITALRQARDRLDELRARAYAGWIEAVLSDDRALIYDGADYEHVLVRAYLALLDLACGEGDARAYLNQMLQRQVELREAFVTDDGEKPKVPLRSAAIGNWLLAALAADDPTAGSEVARQLAAVLQYEPDCVPARAEQVRFAREGLSRPGHGVVQVVALVGLGPYRVAKDEPVSSLVLEIAHRIYNARRQRVALPVNAISQVQIADLALRQDNPSEVHVAVGAQAATTQTVTSVDRLAQAEFASLRTQIVVRAVVRRIFKLAAAEVLKAATVESDDDDKKARDGKQVDRRRETEQQRKQREEEERKKQQREQLGSLVFDALALLWVGLEDADTRCWALLPASFQVARLELPEGDHDVVLRAGDRGQIVGAAQSVRVRVRAGRTSFVIAQVPGKQGGPPPVTSEPVAEGAAPMPESVAQPETARLPESPPASPSTPNSRLRFR
jgi:hypothetical protein